jgi:sugar phosphate isomerase/epimerase
MPPPENLSSPAAPRYSTCFSTLGSPDFDWQQTLDFAVAHGFDGVELRCLSGAVITPANLSGLLPKPSQLTDELRRRGLRFQMFGTSAKLLTRTDNELQDLVELGKFADATGCPWLRIFDGGSPVEQISSDTLDATTAFLSDWESLRQEHDIQCQIAVETHDAFASLAQTRAAIAQLPPFAILWDTHHTWRFGESLTEYYDAVRDRTVHYHLKDSINRPSKRKPFTYVEPGTGEFPWNELHSILATESPRGFLSFEWERHWNPELAPIADVVAAFHRLTTGW